MTLSHDAGRDMIARSASEGDPPRVYFARAIDGENSSSARLLASAVARELEESGMLMIDPVASEPLFPSSNLDMLARHKAIVDHDLSVLRTCHAVLMDISIPGRSYIGCICEMIYAYSWHIPCVVYLGNVDGDRPWLRYHATAIFQSRPEAISHLRTLLAGRSAG
jgi:hypothetical protein